MTTYEPVGDGGSTEATPSRSSSVAAHAVASSREVWVTTVTAGADAAG